MDFNKVIKEKGIDNIEEVLNILKQNGFSQMESVRLLVINLRLSITEADRIVINSKTWNSEKNTMDSFRNKIEETMSKIDIDDSSNAPSNEHKETT